ncbi:1619_t:CDS:2 [Paraglomus occultum]|uniref:1619_t:CDS:1 n=1 Tax=Paraglomus occultum TaxID=144539 RepID=A0A9N8VQ04_9GLOM|nr:1619_t:CDS:2 [Paraglomus occultum]
MRSSIVSRLRNSPELIRLSRSGFDDWCPTDSLTVELMCMMLPSDTDNDSHEESIEEKGLVDRILSIEDNSEQGSRWTLVTDPLILRTLSPGARYVDVRDHGQGCYGVIWCSDRSSFEHCIKNSNALIKVVKANRMKLFVYVMHAVGNAAFRLVFGNVDACLIPKIGALNNAITQLLDVLRHPEDYMDRALEIFERVIRCFNELDVRLKRTEKSMKKFVERQETFEILGSLVELAAVLFAGIFVTFLYKNWQTIGWDMKIAHVLGISGTVGIVFSVNQLKEVAVICGRTVENVQLLLQQPLDAVADVVHVYAA